MKKNRILFTMCAVAALTACTDNELSSVTEGSNTGKAAIELTVAPEVETRGVWELSDKIGKFKWNLNDKIGLSMVSREKTETITDSHYTLTNYEFTASDETGIQYPSKTGYFTTQNATVFSGKYVAYYPYDDTYKDPSLTIPVSSPYIQYTSVASVDPEVRSLFAGDHSFAYSQPFAMEGGTEAKGEIILQNLSGSFMLNLKADLKEKFGTSGISYIIATTGAFNLGQTKDGAGEFPVKGDLKSVIVTPGDNAATYDNENGFQEALILHMSTVNKGGYDANGALMIGDKDEAVYMVTLPRPDFFTEGYKFYLVDINNKAYEIEKTAEAIAVSGKYTSICGKVANFGVKNADVTETKVNGQNVYVAADGASLASLSKVANGSKIYIFNNIELESNLTFINSVELIAAKNQGKITVPAGKKLTFNANSTINTEVEIEKSTTPGLIADAGLTIGTKGKVSNSTPFEVKTLTQVVVAGEYTNNATFTIEAPAATTSEANRGLKVTGKFTNNKTVDNYGTVSNVKGKFTNEGNFLDEIGSKLSGTSMAQNGQYICIVDRQERLLEAIKQRPSTTIRLKKCAVGVAGAGGTVAYDFQDNDWSKYDFEVVADNSSDYVRIQNSKQTAGTAKIKSLTVKVGRCYQEAGVKLEIAENLEVNNSTEMLVRNMLTVNGEVTTAGKFGIEAAASNLTDRMKVLGNFTIVSDGSATFNNNIIVRIFGADGVVNELGGSFVITDATEANKVPAIVYAKAFSGNGTWANYPTVVNDPEKPYNN